MFESLSVMIIASNETVTFKQLLNDILKSDVYDDISQIVLFLKSENCPSAQVARQFTEEIDCEKIEIQIQKTFTVGSAFLEIPQFVKGSHFVIMASDGEADADTLTEFVRLAKQKPESIICGSKWHKDSLVENASFIREIGSRCLNRFAAIMFGVKASDVFSIFQIYPAGLYKKLNANLFEYTLIPLRLGVEYIEIPTRFKREEGRESNFNFFKLLKLALRYVFSIFRVRFAPKDKLWKS